MMFRIFCLVLVIGFSTGANASASLDPEFSTGKVTRVLCQNGDFVKKGQPVYEISVGTKMPFIIRAKTSGFFQSIIKVDEQLAIHILKAGNFFSISSSLKKESNTLMSPKKVPLQMLQDISTSSIPKENSLQKSILSWEKAEQPSSKQEEFLELPKVNIPNAVPSGEKKEAPVDRGAFAPEETPLKNFSSPQTTESASLKLPEAFEESLDEINTKKFSLKSIRENISNLFQIRASSLVALLILFSFGLFFIVFLAKRFYYIKITLDSPSKKF